MTPSDLRVVETGNETPATGTELPHGGVTQLICGNENNNIGLISVE